MLVAQLLAQQLPGFVVQFFGGRIVAKIGLQIRVAHQARRIRRMIHAGFHAQDVQSFFEHRFGVRVSSDALIGAREIDAQRAEFFAEFRRRLRLVNRERFFHAGDCFVVIAHETREFRRAYSGFRRRADRARPRSLRANGDRLFGELSPLRVLIGIAAQQREVVRAFGVIERVFADFRLANFKRLPQRRFAGFQVARGVLEESETIQAVRGLLSNRTPRRRPVSRFEWLPARSPLV